MWLESDAGTTRVAMGSRGFGNKGLEPGEWIPFALELYEDKLIAGWDAIVNVGGLDLGGSGFVVGGVEPRIASSSHPLTMGGIDQAGRSLYPWPMDEGGTAPETLPGSIDDVRLSSDPLDRVALRRKGNALIGISEDRGPWRAGQESYALWRFDPGKRFVDSSGNRHQLLQFIPGVGLAVDPRGSMATTWAALKRP